MALTKLDVCNMALGYIGTRTIQQSELESSPPNSPEALQCVLYWDRARREVLSDFPYRFAVRRMQLVAASSVPYVWSEWSNAYNYPSDAIKVLSVHHYIREERIPFVVEFGENTNDRFVLCNDDSAQCIYVKDVEAITAWDEKFVAAMALKLAILISTALLKNNPEKIKELAALYQASIPGERLKDGGWAVETENSKLNVFNAALGLVGARMVSAVSENCEEAVQCNLYWDRARKSVLRDFPYRFAVRRSAPSSTTMPSVYGGTWTHCFTAPSDMLKVLSVCTATDKQTRQPFAVEFISTGAVILSNAASIQITYIADVTDPALWDEKFTAAMSAKLALFVCGPLLAGEKDAGLNKAKELGELYKASTPQEAGWEPGGWAASGETERLNVCNIALGYLGVKMLTHLGEDVPESVQCRLNWDRARRAALRDYPYRFSIHRVALAARQMPAVYGGEWSKAYTWPSDALRVLSVHNTTDREARQPFAVEYMADGTAILCNVEDAEVTYIADVENTALWDEKFIPAMARRLALEIAPALLPADKLQGKMQELSRLYQMALPGPPMIEENWAVEQNSTRLNICNMALGYVEARTISSIAENIPEAIQCSLHWDNARRSALRDFPYRFAQKRFQLVPVAMPDMYKQQGIPAAGSFWDYVYGDSFVRAGGGGNQWQYCYKMPDCLKIVRIHDGRDRIHRIPFAIELVGGKPCIFTNVPNAQATCTIDNEDVEQWDELFVQAMARKLAILIYPALKKELPRYEQSRRA